MSGGAGRSCPASYGYSASVFRRAPDFATHTPYVAGGLYGNPEALDAIEQMAALERAGTPVLVFNDDFHWFADSAVFDDRNRRVLRHIALRGNVETELAAEDAGFGCGYPDAVSDLEVAHANRILQRLQGSMEKPGRNVKAKSGLNRSILDQGWSEFRRQLEYKQGWLGGRVVAVPSQYTSQRCACCGHVDAANRLSQGRFACLSCRPEANVDFNAACNIFAAGHAVLACEKPAQSGRFAKQEPTEATRPELAFV